MDTPLVSVVLSVYNGADYIKAAIQSILDQSFSDFELIIIDDGSTDETAKIIDSFDDSRLVVITHKTNKLLIASLNEGIQKARGTYIARQDADDTSLPSRLEHEVAYLNSHPDVALVGTNYLIVDEADQLVGATNVFCHPDDLKVAEMLSNQFGHGSVMMRKELVTGLGMYDSHALHVEDYDLFTRISRVAKIANLPQALYRWQRNPEGISLSNSDEQAQRSAEIRNREFTYFMQHRSQYRVFSSFHPFSMAGGPLRYLDRKSAVFRNFAHLFWGHHKRFAAFKMQLSATVLAPWRKVNYRCLLSLMSQAKLPANWEFESL